MTPVLQPYVSPLLLSLGLAVDAQAKLESLVSNCRKSQQGGRPVSGQWDDNDKQALGVTRMEVSTLLVHSS